MMQNTNKKYELYGGLKGTLSSTIAYNAKVSYSSLDNLALYVNDTGVMRVNDPLSVMKNRFDVIYDDAELLSISGQISYQQREKLRIGVTGSYSNYKMKAEARAWYMPQLKFSLFANYNLRDKIVAKVDLFYLGNQFAKTYEADTTASSGQKVVAKELKGTFDANLGVEYRYTKKLGFFVNFNNIANYRYYRYSNYPTQRFGFMAGLSYSF
jgi:outer membrane receptor protein involved in Fe transport